MQPWLLFAAIADTRCYCNRFTPSDAAALSVPSVPSVACSTPIALEWDEAFKNQNDPSGRAVAKVHEDAYNE